MCFVNTPAFEYQEKKAVEELAVAEVDVYEVVMLGDPAENEKFEAK